MKNLIYKVGYTVDEDARHGIAAHHRIIASFESIDNAEEFIKKCMPSENQDRIFITVNGYKFYPVSHIFKKI